jgi:hemolysin III
MRPERPLSLGEEIANAVTHGVGLVASLIGVPVLLVVVISRGNLWQIIGCSIFAITLVALYATSTLYHALPPSRTKQRFQLIDHAAIYLLIAGSYTPFTLGLLRGPWGWTLSIAVWCLAGLGILFKAVCGMRFPRLSTLLYILMGWLAVLAIRPLAAVLPGGGLGWLFAGGLLYTGGVIFFLWEKPRYNHMLWHLFVLAGSVCHFLAVLWYATTST